MATVNLFLRVDADLKKSVKLAAVEQGTTMQELIVRAVETLLKEQSNQRETEQPSHN